MTRIVAPNTHNIGDDTRQEQALLIFVRGVHRGFWPGSEEDRQLVNFDKSSVLPQLADCCLLSPEYSRGGDLIEGRARSLTRISELYFIASASVIRLEATLHFLPEAPHINRSPDLSCSHGTSDSLCGRFPPAAARSTRPNAQAKALPQSSLEALPTAKQEHQTDRCRSSPQGSFSDRNTG